MGVTRSFATFRKRAGEPKSSKEENLQALVTQKDFAVYPSYFPPYEKEWRSFAWWKSSRNSKRCCVSEHRQSLPRKKQTKETKNTKNVPVRLDQMKSCVCMEVRGHRTNGHCDGSFKITGRI